MFAKLCDADGNCTMYPDGVCVPPFPDDTVAGIYIIECDCLPNSFKIGWTRNINRRIWHPTYDFASPSGKRYAYALLFRFRDATVVDEGTPTYRAAAEDELSWIREQFETQLLQDTSKHCDAQMGTEWRSNIHLQECIKRIRGIADVIVNDDMLPADIQPSMVEAYCFQPHRLHAVRKHFGRVHKARQSCGFRRWKTNVHAMRKPDSTPPQSSQSSQSSQSPQSPHSPLTPQHCTQAVWQERDYQTTIIEHCTKHLQQDHSRMYLELATGAGKSYLVYSILGRLQARHVLIFSPRKNINEQNVLWKYVSLLPNHTNRVVINFSNPTQQTPAGNYSISYVMVACPQHPHTLQKIKQFLVEKDIRDVCVWFDEAHHTVESWAHADSPDKQFFLFDDRIKHRLFTSASPDATVVGAHKRVFGQHYSPILVNELIAQGWLCPIVPYVFRANKKGVDICRFILEQFTLLRSSHGFSFHCTCDNASKLFERHMALYKEHQTTIQPFLLVGGEYTRKHRHRLNRAQDGLNYACDDIKTFEATPNSIGYVCQKFAMGYDFSKIDFLVMSDPKTSVKDIKQCLGRGTRPDKLGPNGTNKHKRLHVMLPVHLDNDDKKHDYQCIRQVLRYLIFDVGIDLKDMIEPPVLGGYGGSAAQDQRRDIYKGTESMEAMLLDVLKDSSTDKSGWTQHRMVRMMQKHHVHDYTTYARLRANRPELFLPKDPFLACNKQFFWMDTHKTNPYYDKQTCAKRVRELVDTHDLDLNDMDTEDVVETLHGYDAKIPPMALERFYGVPMY